MDGGWPIAWLLAAVVALAGLGLIHGMQRLRRAERTRRDAARLCDKLLEDGQGLVLGLQVVALQLPSHDPRRRSIETLLDDADRIMATARQQLRH